MSGPKLAESGNLEEFLKRASAEIERATLEVLPSKEPYKELYSIQKDYGLLIHLTRVIYELMNEIRASREFQEHLSF